MSYLVVDDDEPFRSRLALGLRRRGFEVHEAATVEEARHQLSTICFERMILDLRMPGGSGLEILDTLRNLPEPPQVVVLTGFGSIATTEAAMKLGAARYLTKPCTLDTILAAFDSEPVMKQLPIPTVQQVAWDHIQRVLNECGGNVSKAAKLLGLDRRSLQRRLAKPPRLH